MCWGGRRVCTRLGQINIGVQRLRQDSDGVDQPENWWAADKGWRVTTPDQPKTWRATP